MRTKHKSIPQTVYELKRSKAEFNQFLAHDEKIK